NVADADGDYAYANLWVHTPNRGWLTIKADNSIVQSGDASSANTVATTAGTHVRTFTFTPTDGVGTYYFSLAAVDSQGQSVTTPMQSINVTNSSGNRPPTA